MDKNNEKRLFLPTPPYLLVPPHTKYENTILSFFSYLEKTSRLCNPEANNTSEKKVSGLHNPEANLMYRKDFRIM